MSGCPQVSSALAPRCSEHRFPAPSDVVNQCLEFAAMAANASEVHLRLYLWWSLCTLYLHACYVRVTIGDSGLCCCTHVNVFQAAANELSHVSVIQSNASKLSVISF